MCRYAFKTYKPHFACFSCRKSFKKPPIEDYLRQRGELQPYKQFLSVSLNKAKLKKLEAKLGLSREGMEQAYLDAVSTCPDCGERMADLGLDFKPPKKTDAKAWRIIQGMYRVGHCFHTCGCIGFGYVPKDHSDYLAYLRSRLDSYSHALKRVSENTEFTPSERDDARSYWGERVKLVEKEIATSER